MTKSAGFPIGTRDSAQVVALRFPPPDTRPIPLTRSFQFFIERLSSLKVPVIVGSADADDFAALHEHSIEVADAVDAYWAMIGAEVSAHSTSSVDPDLFDRPLFKAIEGNALFAICAAAKQWDEDNGQFGVGA